MVERLRVDLDMKATPMQNLGVALASASALASVHQGLAVLQAERKRTADALASARVWKRVSDEADPEAQQKRAAIVEWLEGHKDKTLRDLSDLNGRMEGELIAARAEAERLRELAATGIGITPRRRLAEDPAEGPLPYVVSLGEAWLTTKGTWEHPATSREEEEHRRFYFYGVEAALAAATAAIGREPDCAEWMR